MINTNLRWAGGKSKMLNILDLYLPQTINKYFEVFTGGGSMLLYIIQKYNPYVIKANDINKNLINYYKDICINSEAIIKHLIKMKDENNADTFEKVFNELDLSNASDFFAKNKTSFGGLFSTYSKQAFEKNFTYNSIVQIKEISNVIKQVDFINTDFMDYSSDIKDYFIYLDPPYYSNKNVGLYGKKGKLHKYFNHEALKEFVDYYSVDNKIMISYDDCEYIRELYKEFNIYNFDFTYSMTNVGGNKCKVGKELVITNYELNKPLYEQLALF